MNRKFTCSQRPSQNYSFSYLVPWKGHDQSVSPSKCLKCQQQQKILFRIWTCHLSSESSNQEVWEEYLGDSHDAYLISHVALPFDVFKGIVFFIKLPVPFHLMDGKSGIGTVSRHLYTCSQPAVTAVSYPIRAGKISNSPYLFLIGQFVEQAGLHPFTIAWKLYGVLRAVRTNLSEVAVSRSYTTVCTCILWYMA